MGGQHVQREGADSFGAALQFLEDWGWEAAGDTEFAKLGAQRVFAALAAGKRDALVDFPDAIALQVVERQFGMWGLAGRAKVFQEARQRFFELIEGDEAGGAGLELAESVKDQERLMRGALVAATPDVELAELMEESVGLGHLLHARGWVWHQFSTAAASVIMAPFGGGR